MTVPSVGRLLHGSINPTVTAAKSCWRPVTNECSTGASARTSAIHSESCPPRRPRIMTVNEPISRQVASSSPIRVRHPCSLLRNRPRFHRPALMSTAIRRCSGLSIPSFGCPAAHPEKRTKADHEMSCASDGSGALLDIAAPWQESADPSAEQPVAHCDPLDRHGGTIMPAITAVSPSSGPWLSPAPDSPAPPR